MMRRWLRGESIPDTYKRLRSQVAATEGRLGTLSPEWQEWLMGFPAGWTDLSASATP
jgi:hypothetical protein